MHGERMWIGQEASLAGPCIQTLLATTFPLHSREPFVSIAEKHSNQKRNRRITRFLRTYALLLNMAEIQYSCNLVLTRATNSSTRVFVSLNIESGLRVELTFFLACSCSSKRDGQLATISSNLNNVAYMFCSNNRSPLFTEHN